MEYVDPFLARGGYLGFSSYIGFAGQSDWSSPIMAFCRTDLLARGPGPKPMAPTKLRLHCLSPMRNGESHNKTVVVLRLQFWTL